MIVPTYNRPGDIENLLASLEPDLGRLEVIVVDDGSPDPAIYDHLQGRYPTVRFLRQERNCGPAAARNRGAREATHELLFFVDSDTEVVPGTIDTIFRLYRENPDFFACGGTISKEPINNTFFARYKALLEASWALDREGRITYIGHIGSRSFTIRRSVMLALGGFNENLPTADVEDYEFGYRLRQAQGPIPFFPGIRVRHRYDTFMVQARAYYRRVILWWQLGDLSPGADDVGTTSREALVAILSTLMTLFVLAGLIWPILLWAALLVGVGAIVGNYRFLGLCWRDQGPLFVIGAFAGHTFLSWFICAGGLVALVKSLIRRCCRGSFAGPASRKLEANDAC